MDDDFEGAVDVDDPTAGGHAPAPSKAVATACHTEEQRATLGRALRTLLGALYERGFDIQTIAGHDMPPGCSPEDPAVEVPLAEFTKPERTIAAAVDREILLVGVVPPGGPRAGSAAMAHDLAPGTQTVVVCMNSGDVRPVRDAVRTMRGDKWKRVHTVIIISFCRLTSFTKREIANMRQPRVQHFNIVDDLQHRALDHHLVPRHVVLSPQQKRRALQKYQAPPGEDTRFPALSTVDPPVRLLGLEPGDLVHVTEKWGRSPPHDTIFVVKDEQFCGST
jgi:DNA-directed RNA polymerase I, II, and III subunit RPABC1